MSDVPEPVLNELRRICLTLPEAYEEPAWVGTRWRIRKKTFAHVLVIEPHHQAAYARAAGTDEPVCTMTFRVPGDEIGGLISGGHPFYKPPWAPDVVGLVIEDGIDWDEVAELLIESYCLMAPKRLAALVERPV